ncbi:ATPase [Candidatus Magnetomorum sp. HK-1]|nr:ATPase [Candidatus Magnetomorum sp. HK-1]
MRINKIILKQIGAYEDISIDFKTNKDPQKAEIHIFSGVNGSGKSTILYALAAGFDSTELEKRFRVTTQNENFQIHNNNSQYDIFFEDHSGIVYSISNQEEGQQEASFSKSTQLVNLKKAMNAKATFQKYRLDFAIFGYSGTRTLYSSPIASIKEISTNPLYHALNFGKSVNSDLIVQWIANTKARIAFAIQDGNKVLAQKYEDSIQRVEQAISDIVGYDVHFSFSYDPMNVTIKINNENLEIDILPDGLKSIISWITDLFIRMERLPWTDNNNILDKHFILLLDEIEIHLHPSWQRKILPVVQSLFKNAQIFIATHSPFVISSISDAWIYKFTLTNGKSSLSEIVPSKAGFSYQSVLDDVFDVSEYFDVDTENTFHLFYQIKNEILSGNTDNIQTFKEIGQQLSQKSIELQDIVGREIRQIERITGKAFIL